LNFSIREVLLRSQVYLYVGLILTATVGCKSNSELGWLVSTGSCRGEFVITDSNFLVRQRFNEYQGSLGCLIDPMPLTEWEKSKNRRFDTKVKCTPQTDLPSMWIETNGNYYSYRDSKIFIELNSSTGEARRLILGEMPDGSPSFQRQVFCYYLRTDVETEPTNPHSYGAMLLFDLELSSSSNSFSPMEIYNYSQVGSDLHLNMMDDFSSMDWTWCPSESVPWGFCDFLRNGNDLFFPEDPSASVQAQLKAEAILIRSEFMFSKISRDKFDSVWASAPSTSIEVGTTKFVNEGGRWKYSVNEYFDEPLFVGREWRKYLRRERPSMPDVAWASTLRFPQVCYKAKKAVSFTDGSNGLVYGEACYDKAGQYSFIGN
jgi:hypothetical protein